MLRHLTYANVVSTVCLVLLLGGSAYAAATITGKDVKNSSLTGKDVKDSSLAGRDVKDASVTGTDLQDASVTGADLQDASVTGQDVADGSIGSADVDGLTLEDLPADVLDLPGASANRVTGTVPQGSQFQLDLTSQGFDTGDMYTPGADVITIQEPGTYLLSGYIAWNDAGGGERQVRLVRNGTFVGLDTETDANDVLSQSVSTVMPLVAGDQIALGSFHSGANAPAPIAVIAGVPGISLTVQMLSR